MFNEIFRQHSVITYISFIRLSVETLFPGYISFFNYCYFIIFSVIHFVDILFSSQAPFNLLKMTSSDFSPHLIANHSEIICEFLMMIDIPN